MIGKKLLQTITEEDFFAYKLNFLTTDMFFFIISFPTIPQLLKLKRDIENFLSIFLCHKKMLIGNFQ